MTLQLALVFAAAAAVALVSGVARWLPVHLFLAGTVVLAISGVTQMLTVTWAAAPAPADRWVLTQRLAITVGAAGVALGRQADLPHAIIGFAGAIYLVGLLLLGVILVATARRAVERRFDAAVAAYVSALLAGTTGVAVGVWMAVTSPTVDRRAAHVTLNLLGLVGLVVGGTLPYFAATVFRARMATHATARAMAFLLAWQVVSLGTSVGGLLAGNHAVAASGLGAYAAGILSVLWMLPRPTKRQFKWAGPRLVAIWAGGGWWAVSVAATAIRTAHGGDPVFGGRWLAVLVIAGYGQILWGSLAYLLPMLRGGGHERLGRGLAATRSWVGLTAINVAGAALALSLGLLTKLAIAILVADGAWRTLRLATSETATARAERQSPLPEGRHHE